MAKGKKKLSVNRFVEVMSRGKVVLDDGASGGRALGFAEQKRLLDMQAQLERLDVGSRELDERLEAYSAAWTKAIAQQDKGEERRLFEALARQTARSVQEMQPRFAASLALANRRQTLVDELTRQFTALQQRIAAVPLPDVRPMLAARLAALRGELSLRVVDASALGADVARLDRLRSESLSEDIERYVVAAEQLQAAHRKLTKDVDAAAAAMTRLPASPVRRLMEGSVKVIRDRQVLLAAPSKSLLDLAARHQSLQELDREALAFDAEAVQARLNEYETVFGAVHDPLTKRLAEVATWEAMPIKTEFEVAAQALLDAMTPVSDIASLDALVQAWGGLAGARHGFKDGVVNGALIDVRGYRKQLDALQAAWQAKTDEARALPPSPSQPALLATLAAMRHLAVPLAQIAELDKVEGGAAKVQTLVEAMQSFDFDIYFAEFDAYRDAWAAFTAACDAKTVAAAGDPDVAAALLPTLDAIREKTVPPQALAGTKDLRARAAALPALKTLVDQIDIAAATTAAVAVRQSAAALRTKIDKKVDALAGSMSPRARELLRTEFTDQLDGWLKPGPVDDFDYKLQRLGELDEQVAARRIEHVPAQNVRFKYADDRIASTQALVAKLPTPALRQAAQDALDGMADRLTQLRLNLAPEGMAGQLLIGSLQSSGKDRVTVTPGEQTRALNNALKALHETLTDPTGTGTKMLELEGGMAFGNAICRMHNAIVTFGIGVPPISAAEALAVHRYTGTSYSAMNRNRRGAEDSDRLAFLNKTCDEALAKLPPYPDNAWPAYRIETAWSQAVVDSRYALQHQFVCGVLWSTGARSGEDIAPKSSPRFTHVIHGRSGRDVAALSAILGEGAGSKGATDFNPNSGRGEVLFPADANFLVTRRTDPPGAPESIRYVDFRNNAHIQTQLKELLNG